MESLYGQDGGGSLEKLQRMPCFEPGQGINDEEIVYES